MQLLFSVMMVICKGFHRSLVNTLVSFTISCPDTIVRVRVRLSDTVVRRVRVRTLIACVDVRVTVCLVDVRNDLMSAPKRIQ